MTGDQSTKVMNTKSILASKTVWVQVIAFLSTFIPAVGDWLRANPVEFVAALGAVNVLVRFITSGSITIFPGDTGTTTGTSGGTSLFIVCGTAAALMGSLPSCYTTVTTNTLPDGTKVTVTAKSSDPVAIKAALDAATLIVPVVEKLAVKQSTAKP